MRLAVLLGLRQPVEVEVAGVFYVITPPTLRGWLLAMEEPLPLLALLDLDDAQRLNARLYERTDPVDYKDLVIAWRHALQSQTGLPWWVSERLIGSVVDQWSVLSGLMALKGIDALESPIDLVLASLLAMVRENQDQKEQRKFDADLYRAPSKAELFEDEEFAPVGFDEQDAAAAWKAAASSRGVRGQS